MNVEVLYNGDTFEGEPEGRLQDAGQRPSWCALGHHCTCRALQYTLSTPSITAASLELRDIRHCELLAHKKTEELLSLALNAGFATSFIQMACLKYSRYLVKVNFIHLLKSKRRQNIYNLIVLNSLI